MALDPGQPVTFDLPVGVTTRQPHTGFVFTAERFEADPAALFLVIACSEGKTEHHKLERLGSTCTFGGGEYRCGWVGDDYDNGHLRAVTLELTRVK